MAIQSSHKYYYRNKMIYFYLFIVFFLLHINYVNKALAITIESLTARCLILIVFCTIKSHFLFYYGFLLQKIAAYESEIRFDRNILDLGDLAIPHAIVSVNKLFKLF
jgi:hypothetical protein